MLLVVLYSTGTVSLLSRARVRFYQQEYRRYNTDNQLSNNSQRYTNKRGVRWRHLSYVWNCEIWKVNLIVTDDLTILYLDPQRLFFKKMHNLTNKHFVSRRYTTCETYILIHKVYHVEKMFIVNLKAMQLKSKLTVWQ